MIHPKLRPTAVATLSALVLAGVAGLIAAGPLNPPAGPVASAYKTLGEVEPRIAISQSNTPGDAGTFFKITQPGSYYLTANLIGVTGKNGIEIAASDVTIDLNGFTLIGTTGASWGIYASNQSRIHICGGTVRGWNSAGIYMYNALASRLDHVTLDGNGSSGALLGSDCIIDSCIARGNGQTGFFVDAGSVIRDCIADFNGTGFSLGTTSRALRCTASGSTGDGFSTYDGVTIQDCISYLSGQNGFNVGTHCLIERNVADANTGAGIYGRNTSIRTLIRGNNATRNTQGIKLDASSNLVTGNTCTLNTTHFVIVAGNRVSSILTLPTSAAINGSTGGTPVADPDANFAY